MLDFPLTRADDFALQFTVKLRSLKLKQVSRDIGSFFVAFEDKDIGNSISIKRTGRTVKAISIQALSSNYFAVLDTVGDVHLLCLSYSLDGLDRPCFMKRLTQTMKVLKLAVFHDISTVSQIIWMSDGCYSVHLMMVSDMNTSLDKTEKKDAIGKLSQTSVCLLMQFPEFARHSCLKIGFILFWNWNGPSHFTWRAIDAIVRVKEHQTFPEFDQQYWCKR
ncbi:hypothetical protein ACS0TY_030922 [Phlomoides rotata]